MEYVPKRGSKSKKRLPAVVRLKNKFRKNGLSIVDSYFNAYFIYFLKKSEKKGHKIKEKFETVISHPTGWSQEIYQKNIYDKYICTLTLIAKFVGIVLFVPSKVKKFFSSAARMLINSENSPTTIAGFKNFFHKIFPIALSAASIIFVSSTIVGMYSLEPAFKIYIDGEGAGLVESIQNLDSSVALVEKNISAVLGISYKLSVDISYKIVLTENPVYLSSLNLYNMLYNFSHESLESAYGLYMDGKLIGSALREEDIDAVLQEILYEQNHALKNSENSENSENMEGEYFEFLNEVRVVQARYPRHSVMTSDELKNAIKLAAGGNSGISSAIDNAIAEAQESNTFPREYIRSLYPANALSPPSENIDLGTENSYYYTADGFLYDANTANLEVRFKKIKSETSTVEVPFAIEYKESDEHYTNTKIIQTEGINGEDEVTVKIAYVDDIEIARDIVDVKPLREPVNQVVLIGTKETPSTAPTGKLICPVKYKIITDKFENGHRGLDMAADFGVIVSAADGGVVLVAGESASYGNYVVIKHSGSMNTLYAHMSELLVKSGEEVFQGQGIGKVGSTGNSTGAHLHFEVLINGEPVDPFKYIE